MCLVLKPTIPALLTVSLVIILSISKPLTIVDSDYNKSNVVSTIELKYYKVTFLADRKILFIEYTNNAFYVYRGLYVVNTRDDSRINSEKIYILKKYAPELVIPPDPRNVTAHMLMSKIMKTSKKISVLRASIDDDGRIKVFVNKSILKLFRGTGLYPISINIVGFSGRVSIRVSGNSTIENETKLINALNHLLSRIGYSNYTRIFIYKETERDPVTYYLFRHKEPILKIWDRVEAKMKELLENCNSSIQNYCDLDYKSYVESDITPTTAGDIFVSNGIVFYLGILDKEIDSIWDIVNNETYKERLNTYLDLIADAFEYVSSELGIDFYGIRVVMLTSLLDPLVGSSNNNQQYTKVDNQLITGLSKTTSSPIETREDNNADTPPTDIILYSISTVVVVATIILLFKHGRKQ